MTGTVIKNTGNDYLIRTPDGKTISCKIKGNFRIKNIKSTNPLAVGDHVVFDSTGFVTELLDRKNYIIRKSINLSKQVQIIAANIDLAMLIVTLKEPETSTIFIDRFLATAMAYDIQVMLIFNKTDLLNDDDLEYLQAIKFLYENIGYQCIAMSAIDVNNIQKLRPYFNEKITLLSGNSGVGKSTIINALVPDTDIKIGEISSVHHSGTHTTTFSEMYEIAPDSFIIDTPGIKGFGVVDMKADEIGHFFPEIFEASKNCRYNNCTHTHEPGCAVIKAVEEHYISESRYHSYLSILEDADEGKYRK